jgi:hypothetical protein
MKRFVLCAVVILALSMVIPTTGCTEKLTLTAEEYNQRGVSLANQGKYEDAIKDYTRAIKLDSKNAQFYYNRGVAYINLEKYDLAIADFTKAIEIDPTDAKNYVARGIAYRVNGQKDMAIADFTVAIGFSTNSDLTAFARKKLEEITNTPVVTPPDSGVGKTPASGATSSLIGLWNCSFEITEQLSQKEEGWSQNWFDVSKLTIRGSFPFSVVDTGSLDPFFCGEEIGKYKWTVYGTCSGEYSYTAASDKGRGEKGYGSFDHTTMSVDFSSGVKPRHSGLSDWRRVLVYINDYDKGSITRTENWPSGEERVEVSDLPLPNNGQGVLWFYMNLEAGTAEWEESWGDEWAPQGKDSRDWLYWMAPGAFGGFAGETATGKREIKVVLSHQGEIGPNGKKWLEEVVHKK